MCLVVMMITEMLAHLGVDETRHIIRLTEARQHRSRMWRQNLALL